MVALVQECPYGIAMRDEVEFYEISKDLMTWRCEKDEGDCAGV